MDFILSTAYYPELWDDATIKNDIYHMKKLGINTVRIGEFNWAQFEPNENDFNFERFSEIMDTLYENGLQIILCTPTAAPPVWISDNHPERMYQDMGPEISHGARQHICTNNPYFRSRVAIIVEKMAQILGKKKGVIAWQIDNELKCHVGECVCDECKLQWHTWLENKYGTIEKLNEAWGTGVWSQSYQDFKQIPQNVRAPMPHNPSLETNYSIFSCEKVNEFVELTANIIRKYSDKPITHNSSMTFKVNNDEMSKHLDFSSFDDYPRSTDYRSFILDCDRFKGLNKSGKFMCMETSPGYNGFTKHFDEVLPLGFVATEAISVKAFGGIGFGYWHFHQQRAGCEMIHGSILSADGRPNICYKQAELVRDRLQGLNKDLEGMTLKQPKVAIHYSDIGKIFIQTENYFNYDYNGLFKNFYYALVDMQISRDVITLDADVSNYDIVFTPFIYALDEQTILKMRDFCEHGGTWVVGPMTAIRTVDHTVHTDSAIPNLLEEILGIKNSMVFPSYGTNSTFNYKKEFGSANHLTTVADLSTAESIFEINNRFLNKPVMTRNNVGKGTAILMGTLPEQQCILKDILEGLVSDVGVEPLCKADEGVYSVQWNKGNNDYVLAFNFTNSDRVCEFKEKKVVIKPYEYIVEKYN